MLQISKPTRREKFLLSIVMVIGGSLMAVEGDVWLVVGMFPLFIGFWMMFGSIYDWREL